MNIDLPDWLTVDLATIVALRAQGPGVKLGPTTYIYGPVFLPHVGLQ